MSAADVYNQQADAVNRGDAEAYSALYAPNAVVHDPAYPEPLEGRDAIRADLEAFMQAIPDLRVSTHALLEAGDTAAGQGSFAGTHLGTLVLPSGEVPPTGRRLEFSGAAFIRLDGQGRVLEEHRYYDLARILSEIGARI
jgi:steroid delta-isomerase-like uncharacterized protein